MRSRSLDVCLVGYKRLMNPNYIAQLYLGHQRTIKRGYVYTHIHIRTYIYHTRREKRDIGFPTRHGRALSRVPRYSRNIYPLPFSKHRSDRNVD